MIQDNIKTRRQDALLLDCQVEGKGDDVRLLGVSDGNGPGGRDLDPLGGRLGREHLVDEGVRELASRDGAGGHRKVDGSVDDRNRRG